MDWIKTKYGYVRKDAIVEVYTSKYVPGTIYLSLSNGESIVYKKYKDDEKAAELAMGELLNYLSGNYTSSLIETF